MRHIDQEAFLQAAGKISNVIKKKRKMDPFINVPFCDSVGTDSLGMSFRVNKQPCNGEGACIWECCKLPPSHKQ